MLKRLELKQKSGGLSRVSLSDDGVSALVCNGANITGGAQVNTVYKLASLKDATDLLINESYDTNNKVLVYEHISEFFRVNPSGTLYLLIAPKDTISATDLVDQTKPFASKIIAESNGEVKQIGIAYVNGTKIMNITEVVGKAQAYADYLTTQRQPVFFVIEGVGFDPKTSSIIFRGLNAKNVSVVIGQSLKVANKTSNPQTKYGAVGTALGAVSKDKVSDSIAWVRNYNMKGGSLIDATAIAGKNITEYSDGDISKLDDNGGLFFITEVGNDGYYFNGSHTCTSLTDDYAYIENVTVMNKATRLVAQATLPWVNQSIPVDAETGELAPTIIKQIENDNLTALQSMLSNVEVSDIEVYINPKQNILSNSRLDIEFSVTPLGNAKKIVGTLGFVNPF